MAGAATKEKPATKATEKDTTATAQGRFVVSLPSDVGEQIDRVGAKLAAAFQAETGIAFELSRAQIVQALVRQALTDNNSRNGSADEDGGDDGDNGDES